MIIDKIIANRLWYLNQYFRINNWQSSIYVQITLRKQNATISALKKGAKCDIMEVVAKDSGGGDS